MPEMRFDITWPDGMAERCYSPSLVIKDHFAPGESYAVSDFLVRARTALREASARVEARYGFPCSLALGQLARLEQRAGAFAQGDAARIHVTAFIE
ncbi:MSMEG_0570 family nitrogen starvation response protein [Plastoroseomonas arctica]|uniref:MSMEG_0570 family nitrogen starvation response protein n=1 Tax=Plastoroseomonas arctica TaxID=1509237 RepID=A0AAF1KNY3_9PROT|nr:MSMEG_0570 family nitrogen starvation response protein [Plastoroseomonas arctica]MBR0656789.1 MSMEG_0570 family nitrogen starvation response protein [Plastoroseomonas arctica]